MARLLQTAQLGAEVLLQRAQEVSDFSDPDLLTLIDDMLATVQEANGVGLAAPQVYVAKRIIIVASRPNTRYPSAPLMEPKVMINPKIVAHSGETVTDWEGCLSIPGIRAQVPRARHLTLKYQDSSGDSETAEYSDFIARIIQHECDHLDGISYLERVTDLKTVVTEKEYLKRLTIS